MKYYLLPERCPKCGRMFDLLLKEGQSIARAVHCKTRWMRRLTETDLRFLQLWYEFKQPDRFHQTTEESPE